jgi:REP element-mobilizing transposase RayT
VCRLCANRADLPVGGASAATFEGIARAPRIEVEHGIFHVVARGNERGAIYRDRADRERFLEILASTSRRYGWRALTYCLMSNQYHLLVGTPNANLARGMRELNGVYAQAFNRRHGRDGHLFQGRYRAILVQADEHLASAVRYIVRNPLRAGMCTSVTEWPWSSHEATIGSRAPGFLATDVLLGYLHESRSQARLLYRALVEGDDDLPRPPHALLAGDEAFVAFHLERLEPSPEYTRAHLAPPRPPLRELVSSSSHAAAIARAHREHGYSMREIATHLECGLTTIHRRIRAHEAELERNGTWKT